MSRFEDLIRDFLGVLVKWLLHTFVKIFFVAMIIGGWYLLQDGRTIIGLVVEVVGLAGLDLSPWVQAKLFKQQN